MNIDEFTQALAHRIADEAGRFHAPEEKNTKFPTPSPEDAASIPGAVVHGLAYQVASLIAKRWVEKTDAQRAAAIKRITDDPSASLD